MVGIIPAPGPDRMHHKQQPIEQPAKIMKLADPGHKAQNIAYHQYHQQNDKLLAKCPVLQSQPSSMPV